MQNQSDAKQGTALPNPNEANDVSEQPSEVDDSIAKDQSLGTMMDKKMASNQICKDSDTVSRKPAAKKTQKPYKYMTLGETLGFPVSKPPSSGWPYATTKDSGSSSDNKTTSSDESKTTSNITLEVPEDYAQLRADRTRICEEV